MDVYYLLPSYSEEWDDIDRVYSDPDIISYLTEEA